MAENIVEIAVPLLLTPKQDGCDECLEQILARLRTAKRNAARQRELHGGDRIRRIRCEAAFAGNV